MFVWGNPRGAGTEKMIRKKKLAKSREEEKGKSIVGA